MIIVRQNQWFLLDAAEDKASFVFVTVSNNPDSFIEWFFALAKSKKLIGFKFYVDDCPKNAMVRKSLFIIGCLSVCLSVWLFERLIQIPFDLFKFEWMNQYWLNIDTGLGVMGASAYFISTQV